MTEGCDCPGCHEQREEIAAAQIQCIVGIVHMKRRREREQRPDLAAIFHEGIAAALDAWDPPMPPVRMQ